MRSILILIAVICLISTPAYALLNKDDHSVNGQQQQGQIAEGGDAAQQQGQGQGQGQLQGQAQGQGQGQAQAAIAAQGQVQGNLGIQRGNDVSTDVNVEGDSGDTYAVSYPALSGGEGVSQANIYSIFGGVGLSDTENYKALITQIQAIEAITTLDPEKKAELVDELVGLLMDTHKDKRFLGVLWKTSGRNLLNVFGILSFDSFWKADQHPFTIQKVKE